MKVEIRHTLAFELTLDEVKALYVIHRDVRVMHMSDLEGVDFPMDVEECDVNQEVIDLCKKAMRAAEKIDES